MDIFTELKETVTVYINLQNHVLPTLSQEAVLSQNHNHTIWLWYNISDVI